MLSLVEEVLHEVKLMEEGKGDLTELRHAVARANTALRWVTPGNSKMVRAYFDIERISVPDNLEQAMISLAPAIWTTMLASVKTPAERARRVLK